MAAQRLIWRGQLRLALVSCPVALYSANHDRGSLHFNLINPKTGHRIRMITQDAETGEELSRRDLVKGYEFKKDTYRHGSESALYGLHKARGNGRPVRVGFRFE